MSSYQDYISPGGLHHYLTKEHGRMNLSQFLYELDDENFLSNYSNSYYAYSVPPINLSDYGSWITDDLINDIKKTYFTYHKTAPAVLIALYILAFIVGLMGNVLVIFIFARNKHMRTVTNSFLVNLAVCDLLVVLLCMPFSVAMIVYENWVYGNVMCKLVNFAQGLSVTSSILTLTVISAERFYAIKRPLKARAFMTRERIQKVILYIWCISVLPVIPLLFVRNQKQIYPIPYITVYTCIEVWKSDVLRHLYNFGLVSVLYVAPVLFICVGYLHIGKNLWRTDSFLYATDRGNENSRANVAGRRKVAKMLFVMALLFALSWLPIQVFSIVVDFLSEETWYTHGRNLRYVHSFFVWLGHMNSSINPICYCIMSTSFKAAINIEMRRLCCRHRYDAPTRTVFSSVSLTMTSTSQNRLSCSPQTKRHSRVKSNYTTATFYSAGRSTSIALTNSQPDLLKHLTTKRREEEL